MPNGAVIAMAIGLPVFFGVFVLWRRSKTRVSVGVGIRGGGNLVDDGERREAAIARLKDKREFRNHVAVYLIVNTLLVVIWVLSGQGYFWPVWPIVGWGIGLVLHGWKVFFEKPISEDEIQREMIKAH